MRVGFLFNHEFILGGGEISFLDLISEIRRLDVVPIAFVPAKGEITEKLDNAGIRYVVSPWPHLNLWSIPSFFIRVKALVKMFADEKLDVVHVNGARAMLYAGPAAKRFTIPCVWHVRVLERDVILDRIRAHYASAIIANSKAVSNSLVAIVGIKKCIDVIYNGFDLEAAGKVEPLDLKKEFGLPNLPVVLCVGRFTRWKAFEDVIKACGILQKRKVDVSLLIVGESHKEEADYEASLKELVKKEMVRNVCFSGWRNDVHAIMKSVDVFVLPSRNEPFGRVIVEAWASGLPVISTNCGGPTELIKDGSSGLLVPVGAVEAMAEMIEKVIKDKTLAKHLSEAGAERAMQFSISRHAEHMLAMYRNIIATMGGV